MGVLLFSMNYDDLKKVRLELGLSQEDIAVHLKTPVGTYSKWERGERRVPGIVEVALELLRLKMVKGEIGKSSRIRRSK